MKSQKVLSEYRKQAENHGMLGKEIRLSPKAHVSLNKPGYGIDFFAPTVDKIIKKTDTVFPSNCPSLGAPIRRRVQNKNNKKAAIRIEQLFKDTLSYGKPCNGS